MTKDAGPDRRGRHAAPVASVASDRVHSRLMPHHLIITEPDRVAPSDGALPTVVDVDVSQSLSQRARGVFTVRVHLQRPHCVEIVTLDNIPDGAAGREFDPEHSARHARPPAPSATSAAPGRPLEGPARPRQRV